MNLFDATIHHVSNIKSTKNDTKVDVPNLVYGLKRGT